MNGLMQKSGSVSVVESNGYVDIFSLPLTVNNHSHVVSGTNPGWLFTGTLPIMPENDDEFLREV